MSKSDPVREALAELMAVARVSVAPSQLHADGRARFHAAMDAASAALSAQPPLDGMDPGDNLDPEDLIGQFASAHAAWNASPMENDVRERYRNAAAALYARLAPAQPPSGWRCVYVNEGFAELMLALERADRKGYMPDAMADEWSAFDYRDAAAPKPEGTK